MKGTTDACDSDDILKLGLTRPQALISHLQVTLHAVAFINLLILSKQLQANQNLRGDYATFIMKPAGFPDSTLPAHFQH
jgi:hypothetical protein